MTDEHAPREVGSNAGLGAPSDADLDELLAFVRGECRWHWLGKGMTSHPQYVDDPNQQRIHAAMQILEARGDVRRHHVRDNGSVTWAPNANITGLRRTEQR